jgi:hypothetical protein
MKTKITTLSKQFSIPGALYFHNLIWLIRIKNDLRHVEHLTKWGWCLSVLLFLSTWLNGVGVAQFYYSGVPD